MIYSDLDVLVRDVRASQNAGTVERRGRSFEETLRDVRRRYDVHIVPFCSGFCPLMSVIVVHGPEDEAATRPTETSPCRCAGPSR